MKKFDFSEMVYVMAAIEENLENLKAGGFDKAQIAKLEQSFAGKKRQFEALEAALLTHYFHNYKILLDSATPEKKAEIQHFVGGDIEKITYEQMLKRGLEFHATEIQKIFFAALDSKNFSFFKDFAFFLQNPLRTRSKLKVWLIEICWGGDGDGMAPFGTPTAPLSSVEFSKFPAGSQRKVFSGEELAELYQKTRGETIEVSLIYRTCRELGIKLKYPRSPHGKRKKTHK